MLERLGPPALSVAKSNSMAVGRDVHSLTDVEPVTRRVLVSGNSSRTTLLDMMRSLSGPKCIMPMWLPAPGACALRFAQTMSRTYVFTSALVCFTTSSKHCMTGDFLWVSGYIGSRVVAPMTWNSCVRDSVHGAPNARRSLRTGRFWSGSGAAETRDQTSGSMTCFTELHTSAGRAWSCVRSAYRSTARSSVCRADGPTTGTVASAKENVRNAVVPPDGAIVPGAVVSSSMCPTSSGVMWVPVAPRIVVRNAPAPSVMSVQYRSSNTPPFLLCPLGRFGPTGKECPPAHISANDKRLMISSSVGPVP
jgi:hypothetical protein